MQTSFLFKHQNSCCIYYHRNATYLRFRSRSKLKIRFIYTLSFIPNYMKLMPRKFSEFNVGCNVTAFYAFSANTFLFSTDDGCTTARDGGRGPIAPSARRVKFNCVQTRASVEFSRRRSTAGDQRERREEKESSPEAEESARRAL